MLNGYLELIISYCVNQSLRFINISFKCAFVHLSVHFFFNQVRFMSEIKFFSIEKYSSYYKSSTFNPLTFSIWAFWYISWYIKYDCFNNIIYFVITDISSKSLLCSEFRSTCAILYVNRVNAELNQHSNVNVAATCTRVSLFLSIAKLHVPFIIDTILTLSVQIIPVPFNFFLSLAIPWFLTFC